MAERLLRVRTRQKSKKPEFNFHDAHKKKRLGTSWRKPQGLHNKLRQQIAAKGKLVRPGFGSPKAVRGFHPCGLREVLVNNVNGTGEGPRLRRAHSLGCGQEEANGDPGQGSNDEPEGTEPQIRRRSRMPGFSTQRRLAAAELGAGQSRVWINPDPEVSGELADAITREDIRSQIEAGNIKAKPKKGNSRARFRARAAKRAYGHRKGAGSRKGRKGRSSPEKRAVDDQDKSPAKKAERSSGERPDRSACLPLALPQIKGRRVQEHGASQRLHQGQEPEQG